MQGYWRKAMALKSWKLYDEAVRNLIRCYNAATENDQPSVMVEIADIYGLVEIGNKLRLSFLEV